MFNQKSLILIAVVLGATKYFLLPAIESYQELSEQYQSVSLRYDKSIAAIEKASQYQSSIEKYKESAEKISKNFGESVNIESYKLNLQQKVDEIISEHGLKQERFGWSKELTETVDKIYMGTLSLRYSGETAATILAMIQLEDLAQVTTLSSFTSTVQGYQNTEFDIGRSSVSVELTIWVKAL